MSRVSGFGGRSIGDKRAMEECGRFFSRGRWVWKKSYGGHGATDWAGKCLTIAGATIRDEWQRFRGTQIGGH